MTPTPKPGGRDWAAVLIAVAANLLGMAAAPTLPRAGRSRAR